MNRPFSRYARLAKVCRARGFSREDARDVVQEAHLRLFAYQRSVKVRDAESLLRCIVINLSITYFHRELSRSLIFEKVDRLDRQEILIDPTPGPERTLIAEQQLDEVVSLLSAVSPRTCQIFIAQRGGYSYEEIAAALAVKSRTVEKHVATAMSTLSQVMPQQSGISALQPH